MSFSATEIHRQYDRHGVIQIFDDGNKRYLSFGSDDEQSCILKTDPALPQLDYVRAMLLVLLFVTPRRSLCLGMGAGSLSHCLHQAVPGLKQQIVELRRGVIDAAYTYFQFPRSKRIEVCEMEAHEFLLSTEGRPVDVIFSDLYDQHGVAAQQLRSDYLFECAQRLTANGWLVLNCWKEHRGEDLLAELTEQFSEIHTCTTQDGNWVILAGMTPSQLSSAQRKQALRELSATLGFALTPYASRLNLI